MRITADPLQFDRGRKVGRDRSSKPISGSLVERTRPLAGYDMQRSCAERCGAALGFGEQRSAYPPSQLFNMISPSQRRPQIEGSEIMPVLVICRSNDDCHPAGSR